MDGEKKDGQDGQCFGKQDVREGSLDSRYCVYRPEVTVPVEKDSICYNMNHKERGKCIVFSHKSFENNLEERKCAKEDADKVKKAFSKLGFEVESYLDLTKNKLKEILLHVVQEDHSERDCLVIVFMSHGSFNKDKNKQLLHVYDSEIEPKELWEDSLRCPSLFGKPKLVFIQTCRGEKTDKGFLCRKKGMPVETDAEGQGEIKYSLPSYCDLLVMWSSFPEHFSFKTSRDGINGSVFIHFLCEVLKERGENKSFTSMQREITRRVAYNFESSIPGDLDKDHNKQIPFTESTLMRKLFFKPKK